MNRPTTQHIARTTSDPGFLSAGAGEQNVAVTRRAFLRDLGRLTGVAAGLGLLAGCAPAPPGAGTARVYRVGLLASGQPGDITARPNFWARMRELGYVEGGNLAREERIAVGDDATAQFDDLAAELVRLPVDVLVVAGGSPVRRAAMAATESIPIVMMGGTSNVVEQGIVGSLARPGRNVTGIVGRPIEIELKRLQLLVEAAPGISRVAVLASGPTMPEDVWEAAAGLLGVDLLPLSVASRAGYGIAFERAMAQGADSLLARSGNPNNNNRDLIIGLAERHRLPGIYSTRLWATSGGLIAYDARGSEIQRRAADYVDRILRGARPADLPVELPTRYDLVVNLKTARALGHTFPPAFLAQVDEVIE